MTTANFKSLFMRWMYTLILFLFVLPVNAQKKMPARSNYLNNRLPLKAKPYIELPPGSIKANGWLHEMLVRQKNGATSKMDSIYPVVMGKTNGWLGGDGDQWERGPYWIDGLLSLAYLLNDNELKNKAKPWIEWILNSQQPSGAFGPEKDYPEKKFVQTGPAQDWWPRMVVLKILQQYYSATGDKRVIPFLTRYFKYQLETLPQKPLDNWSYWAKYRACDNMEVVYWLYNITGDRFLLQLGELLHKQSYDFAAMFMAGQELQKYNSIHCVNLSQGIKEPAVFYQQSGNMQLIDAVKKGFDDIRRYNGQAQGMFGGDEGLHGNAPTQGVELCAIVEMMYSLEKIIGITGDVAYMDHLEKLAFNALPTQISDDFMYKQYFQQANQVMCTRHPHRNFYEDNFHGGTDLIFGTLSGYPCCFSNMHQGWPRFAQHLWYATADNGVAAFAYSPSEVDVLVADRVKVHIVEDTYYPMDDKISFTVNVQQPGITTVAFPFHLRVPSWCGKAAITVNGKPYGNTAGGKVEIINRTWRSGDKVEVTFPMEVKTNDSWPDKAVSVERGPLLYALKIEEQWDQVKFPENEQSRFGDTYYEVRPKSAWNYGLVEWDRQNTAAAFEVKIDTLKMAGNFFWNLANAPIAIKAKAKKIPYWTLYNDMTGPLPFSTGATPAPTEEVTLIPYGCTTLRISEFPRVME